MDDPLEQQEAEFPPQLRDDLRALDRAPPAVPPEVEARILSRARLELARRAHHRRRWPLRVAALATAAAALLLLVLRLALWTSPSPPPQHATVLSGDVNGDGVVNIVDAMLLARSLDSPRPVDSVWDVNGDGVVDRADVDEIAMLAVRLDGRPQ